MAPLTQRLRCRLFSSSLSTRPCRLAPRLLSRGTAPSTGNTVRAAGWASHPRAGHRPTVRTGRSPAFSAIPPAPRRRHKKKPRPKARPSRQGGENTVPMPPHIDTAYQPCHWLVDVAFMRNECGYFAAQPSRNYDARGNRVACGALRYAAGRPASAGSRVGARVGSKVRSRVGARRRSRGSAARRRVRA